MQYTENLRLKKPEGTDFYNIDDFNENADKVEAKILEVQSRTEASINTLSANKANKIDFVSHANNKNNPHSITKAQVGLGNVDNTADKDKNVKYSDTTGKLSKAVKINGVDFDGSKDITIGDSVITDTATGETIILNDSADGALRKLKVYGKTEQFTTNGKNLFGDLALANKIVEVASDRLYTNLDTMTGIIEFCTWGNSGVELFTDFKENTQYTFILSVYETSYTDYTSLAIKYTDGTYDEGIGIATDGKVVYTSKNGKSIQSICFYVYDDVNTILYYNECGIFEGVVTLEEFEEYTGGVPMPTPDNPKDIICVGANGKVDVTIAGKNLLNGLSFAKKIFEINDGYHNIDTVNGILGFSSWGHHGVELFTDFKENTQYTFILSITDRSDANCTCLGILYTDGTYDEGIGIATDGKVVYTSKNGKSVQALCLYVYNDYYTYLCYNECGIFEGVVTLEEFEEYKFNEVTISIPLSSPLNEGDNITLKNGKLEIVRNYKMVDFPTISKLNNYTYGRKNYYFSPDGRETGFSKCTHMKKIISSDKSNYGFTEDSYGIYFIFPSDETVETANAKMAGAKILYKLKMPTVETIDINTNLSTYCGVSNIITNPDNANMEVEYFVDSAVGNVVGDLQEQVNETKSYLNDFIVVEEFQVSSNEYTIPHNERWEFELIVNKSGYIPLMATFDNADLTNISYAKCAVFKRDADYKVSCDVYNNENSNVSVRGTIRVLYVKA